MDRKRSCSQASHGVRAARMATATRAPPVTVLDSYGRRCAITNEKTLPVLEAAHIRDYHELAVHSINNGILLCGHP